MLDWWHGWKRLTYVGGRIYDCSGNLKPNCWKKHVDDLRAVARSMPDHVEEVALYDLLKKHFNPGIDAWEEELELERFH